MLQQFACAQRRIELPGGTDVDGQVHLLAQGLELLLKHRADFGAVNHLAGRNAGQPVGQFIAGAFGQMHQALGDAQPRQATPGACALVHRQHKGFALVRQQGAVGQRAGGDHAHHLALDRAFAGGHIAHLFANGHRFAQLEQTRQIGFDRVKRHPRHHHRLAARLAALRERDVEQAGGLFGIGKEQLVEVAHAVEQQRVGVLGLEAEVLLHHGGVRRQIRHGSGPA